MIVDRVKVISWRGDNVEIWLTLDPSWGGIEITDEFDGY